MVPEGWKISPLQEVAAKKIVYGIVQAGEHVDNGIRYIKSSDVGGEIRSAGLSRTAPIIHQKYHRSTVRPGDIVFSLRGNTGATSIVPDDLPEANLTQGTARVSVASSHNNRFIRYVLASDIVMRQVLAVAKGSTFTEVSLDALRKMSVPIPPLPEQRKIADILSTWDRAIETSEALLATARTQKRALMQSLLTGKRRFPEFEGQEWKEVRLGDVADIRMGSSPKSSAYNQDGVGLPLIQGNADIRNGRTFPRSFTSEVTTTCEPGDILLSVRAPVGTVAISEHTACVGRGAAVILPRAGTSWLWLKHLMLALEAKWTKVSQGSTFDAVNSKDIKAFAVSTPNDTAEQDRLGEVLEVAEQEILSLLAQIEKLRTEKQALMQQLLTGKRRVVV